MNEDNKYIMWLASINNIRLSVKRNLLEYFGSGKELWQADSKDLKYSKVASQAVIEKIVAGRYKYSFDNNETIYEDFIFALCIIATYDDGEINEKEYNLITCFLDDDVDTYLPFNEFVETLMKDE